MKKYFSRVICLALTFSMFSGISAFASEVELNRETLTPNQNMAIEKKDITTRAHDVEYKRKVYKENTVYHQYIGTPDNGKWTTFTKPGQFCWSDGGNKTSVTITLGSGYGSVSASIPLGKTGGSELCIAAPTNVKCRLVLYRDVTVTKYEVYRRLTGTKKWIFDHYETGSSWDNTTLEVETKK